MNVEGLFRLSGYHFSFVVGLLVRISLFRVCLLCSDANVMARMRTEFDKGECLQSICVFSKSARIVSWFNRLSDQERALTTRVVCAQASRRHSPTTRIRTTSPASSRFRRVRRCALLIDLAPMCVSARFRSRLFGFVVVSRDCDACCAVVAAQAARAVAHVRALLGVSQRAQRHLPSLFLVLYCCFCCVRDDNAVSPRLFRELKFSRIEIDLKSRFDLVRVFACRSTRRC